MGGRKIGQLERTHQVWRQKADLRRNFPSGPDTWYWCQRCGDVIATLLPIEMRSCECGNVFFDVGRCVIEDFDQVVVRQPQLDQTTPRLTAPIR
jgi:hypothetical protein